MSIKKITFNYTGANQTFTVTPFVEHIIVKAWGAGGGNGQGQSNGGPGGYTTGTLPVSSGQTLNIMVGQGGAPRSIATTYGGGGAGGNDTSGFNIDGASGGGRSGVSIGAGAQLIIAGGGGGGAGATAQNVWSNGGAGGGLFGVNGWVNANGNQNAPGKGGTQNTGGAGGIYIFTPLGNGVAGVPFQGGAGGNTTTNNTAAGGGGGGGYYGGGGGAGQYTNNANPLEQDCAGGGGSAYIDPTVLNGTTINTPQNTNGAAGGALVLPPETGDADYLVGRGVGASGFASGGNGLVVIIYNQPDLIMTKSVSSYYADLNDTLTYTITVNNNGPVTVTNITFVDTVPANTSFVSNSLTLDGNIIAGTPNPPGITIPSIAPNSTSTIQFSVKIPATIPSPSVVSNVSTSSYTGGFVFNSNAVVTTINHATISSAKITSLKYADLFQTITYSIVLKNTGSTTANTLRFVDTIPTGMTFIANSLKQDSTSITGSPAYPGVTLPNSIGPGVTSTISFQVVANSIPTINPIQNTATTGYVYTVNPTIPKEVNSVSSSNTVTTQINNANLTSITKYVDKKYATCGDTISYSIYMTNLGNMSANNVVFKDTIPTGTSLVPDSIYVNGIQQIGANVQTGVTIPNIEPSASVSITFMIKVNC